MDNVQCINDNECFIFNLKKLININVYYTHLLTGII